MEKIPLILLTGFLGSGKTTLLNGLLKTDELADSAVLINEFGAVALDHHLVGTAGDRTVVLSNGCVCCTVRGQLSGALRTLFWQRDDKTVPHFRRVIVETTGLADPAPIIHELMNHPTILQHFRLAGVVTCVDALFGARQLEQHPEARKQAAMADRLLLTKSELVGASDRAALEASLRTLNPAAVISAVIQGAGQPAPGLLLDSARYDPLCKQLDVRQWLQAEAYRQVPVAPGLRLGRRGAAPAADRNRHGSDIRAFCLTFDQALPWGALITGLEMLAMLRGDQLLRVKGIVDAIGFDRPRVIHGVQSMFFPPTTLAAWPDGSRQTRLVFIVRDLDENFIANSLNHFLDAARDGAPEP